MNYDSAGWVFAGQVLTSEGFQRCAEFLDSTLPKEWRNGLAAHWTNQRTSDPADLVGAARAAGGL